MAGKRITTELVVKAVDQYSGMIRNMTGVTGRFASKVRSEMGRMQGLRGPLRMIEDFRRHQDVVRGSANALHAANDKTRRLLSTIRATKKPTAAMRREFERARATAERLEEKHRRNRAELRGLQSQMRSAGVDVSDLEGEQRRLAGALDAANSKFALQAERMQRLKVMQDRIAEGRERMQRSLATAANLGFVGNASMQTGRRILTGMSAPVIQAVEFESAMSDVRKVVDFESPAAFRKMSDDVLELSTRIPIAATGLAEIVAAGGQSGIAQGELARFAEMAAKIGVAFDISAGQSGEAMASIRTAMGLGLDQTGSLFDAMNHLSNNSAARADQTLEFLNRAGADGSNFGFDSTETLAIGAAMIAAGAGADTAATSFRNMGRALVRGESATDRQSEAILRLGLESDAVARAMQEDAVGTTMDVMRRLNELPDHLRASVMSDLFGDEARELTKLMNNMRLMPEMLALVADEAQYLGSAEAEYAERSRTTANNMQLLRNQATRLGISIGEVVLPPLNELLAKSQVFVDKLVTWTKENPKLTKTLVVGGIALGGMAVAGGFLLTAAAGLIGTMAVLRFGLVGLGARALFAGGGLRSLGGAFGVLAARKGQVSGLSASLVPFTASKAKSVRAVAGGLRLLASVSGLGLVYTGLVAVAGVVATISAPVWASIAAVVAAVGSAWYYWDRVGAIVRGVGAGLSEVFSPALSDLQSVFEKLEPVLAPVASLFDRFAESAEAAWGAAKRFFSGFSFSRELLSDREKADLTARSKGLTVAMVGGFLSANREMVLAGGRLISSFWNGAKAQFAEFMIWVRKIPSRITSAISQVDLSAMIKWPTLPSWMGGGRPGGGLADVGTVPPARPPLRSAGARAFGGSVHAGLPYRVNEHTPKSEWFVPSASGGVLNVRQAQAAFMSHFGSGDGQSSGVSRGAQRVRSASMAALTASALVGSTVAAAAGGGGASGKSMSARVEIGSISIVAPSGVSDPEGLVGLIEDRLGDRIAATFDASFSD